VSQQHRDMDERFGNQADRVAAEAREHSQKVIRQPESATRQGVTYARDHFFGRSAVESGQSVLTAALDRSINQDS
jgi:hypothetical protein